VAAAGTVAHIGGGGDRGGGVVVVPAACGEAGQVAGVDRGRVCAQGQSALVLVVGRQRLGRTHGHRGGQGRSRRGVRPVAEVVAEIGRASCRDRGGDRGGGVVVVPDACGEAGQVAGVDRGRVGGQGQLVLQLVVGRER